VRLDGDINREVHLVKIAGMRTASGRSASSPRARGGARGAHSTDRLDQSYVAPADTARGGARVEGGPANSGGGNLESPYAAVMTPPSLGTARRSAADTAEPLQMTVCIRVARATSQAGVPAGSMSSLARHRADNATLRAIGASTPATQWQTIRPGRVTPSLARTMFTGSVTLIARSSTPAANGSGARIRASSAQSKAPRSH